MLTEVLISSAVDLRAYKSFSLSIDFLVKWCFVALVLDLASGPLVSETVFSFAFL